MRYENEQWILCKESCGANSPSIPECRNPRIPHCGVNLPILQKSLRVIQKWLFIGLWIMCDWPARCLSQSPYWGRTMDQPRISDHNSPFGDVIPIVFSASVAIWGTAEWNLTINAVGSVSLLYAPRGATGCHLSDSFTMAFIYERFSLSLNSGNLLPTTLSSSSCAFFWTSG